MTAYHALRCIYIQMPKAGSSSIHAALVDELRRRGSGEPPEHHHTSLARVYADAADPHALDQYFAFTYVRNPYSRLVSLFLNHPGPSCFRYFVAVLVSKRDSGFLASWSRPQWTFVSMRGRVLVDDVFQIERLDETWDTVCRRLSDNLGSACRPTVGRLNATPLSSTPFESAPFQSFYTEELRQAVWSLYRRDFDWFGYGAELPEETTRPADPPLHLVTHSAPREGREVVTTEAGERGSAIRVARAVRVPKT